MLVAVLMSGTMSAFDKVHESGYITIMRLLELMDIPYNLFIYTNEYGFFKKTPEEYIKDGTAHGHQIEKESGSYKICKIGKEYITKKCNEIYSNIKSLEIHNEEDIYRNNQYLMSAKIKNNYLKALSYEKEHNISHDIFIYIRPDAYVDVNHLSEKHVAKRGKYLKSYLESLIENPHQIWTRSSEAKEVNSHLYCSVSQSHAYCSRESMAVLATLSDHIEDYIDRIKRCSACLVFDDEAMDRTTCRHCDKKYRDLVAEYRIYQHLYYNKMPVSVSEIGIKKFR